VFLAPAKGCGGEWDSCGRAAKIMKDEVNFRQRIQEASEQHQCVDAVF
jgi:hypothetical protein